MADIKSNQNPANEKEIGGIPADYMPMGAPTLKLEVPEKPGWHRRWIRGEAGRLQRAMRAGYRFVTPDEVTVNNTDIAGGSTSDGNTDLGSSRVSVISGDKVDATGQPGRLYLMECPIQLYNRSRSMHNERNVDIAETLKGGSVGSEKEAQVDKDSRYVDKKRTRMPDMFTPKLDN